MTSSLSSASGRFRPVSEVVAGVGSRRRLVADVEELLNRRYYFESSRGRVRYRPRRDGEERQLLLDVVAFFDLPHSSGDARGAEEPAERGQSEDFDPSEDTDVESGGGHVIPSGGGLVLSEPPGDLVLDGVVSASMTSAALARKGSGKSYFVGVVCEEMLRREGGTPVAVIDPMGVFWGLLSTASGRPSPYKLLLLGGSRGHLPLKPAHGKAAARVVSGVRPTSVVLDLSEMVPAEQHLFVADFCEELLALPKFTIHLVIDEADEFAPQRFRAGSRHQPRCLGYVERIIMRGRSRGIGATLTSLRPAVVSKNVLSQVDSLCLMCMIEPNDLRAVESWLVHFDHRVSPRQKQECLSQLPILPVGTAYYLRGGEQSMFRRFRVRRKTTYDSSKTLVEGAMDQPTLSTPGRAVVDAARSILEAPGGDV